MTILAHRFIEAVGLVEKGIDCHFPFFVSDHKQERVELSGITVTLGDKTLVFIDGHIRLVYLRTECIWAVLAEPSCEGWSVSAVSEELDFAHINKYVDHIRLTSFDQFTTLLHSGLAAAAGVI